ncbi:MAG: hypothetical protein ACI9TH_003636, partial [Kiritimatiellia bacterium]
MNFFSNTNPVRLAAAILGLTVTSFAEPVSFKNDIAPILLEKCQSCHGPKKQKGKYRLDSYEQAMKTEAGELHFRVSTDDEDERMPPETDPLKPDQIALFKRWMDEGAKYDAEDPKASLASITPGITHPEAPKTYARAIPITALSFSHDGQHLRVSGYREITVWHIKEKRLQRRIGNLPERIHSIDLHVDGNSIAIAGGNPGRLGEVRILESDSGALIQTLHKSEDLCFSARFSPDGQHLATGGADGTVRVFKTADWSTEVIFSNHSDWVNQITWHSDGSKIGSASRDHTAKVFDLAAKKRLTSYTGHNASIYAILFHPTDANEVFSAAADGKLMRWRINDGGTVREYLGLNAAMFQLAKIDPLEQLALAASDPHIHQIDWNDPGKRSSLAAGIADQLSIAVSQDGNWLAAGDRVGKVRVW